MVLGGDKKLIANFFAQLRPLRYKKGEIILRPDNLNPGVNFLEKGYIKVYSITEEGNEKLHIIFKPGSLFPLIWVFKNIIRDVYYEAIGEVVLKKSTKEDFVDFIKGDHGAALELVYKMTTTLEAYADRIDELEYIKSYPRIVSSLITFSKHFGKRIGKGILLDVPLTQRDIASSANMTRETASREIELLIKKKIITYRGHSIVIRDMSKLRKELSTYFVSGDI